MQSPARADGTYSLTVTFTIGTDPNLAQVLVQNRVSIACRRCRKRCRTRRVTAQKKSTRVLSSWRCYRRRRPYDSCTSPITPSSTSETSCAAPGRRRRHGVRRRPPSRCGSRSIQPASGARADAAATSFPRSSSRARGHGRRGRRPANAAGQAFQYTLNVKTAGSTTQPIADIIVKVRLARNGDRSPGCATSARSNSEPRPTADRLARQETGDRTSACSRLPGERARGLSGGVNNKMATLRVLFRKASNSRFRSTPPSSSTSRFARSTKR